MRQALKFIVKSKIINVEDATPSNTDLDFLVAKNLIVKTFSANNRKQFYYYATELGKLLVGTSQNYKMLNVFLKYTRSRKSDAWDEFVIDMKKYGVNVLLTHDEFKQYF